MFYSKSTGGFYTPEIHKVIPADAVAITDAQWRALLDGQSQGKVIEADANGRPVLGAPAPPAPYIPYTVTPFQAKAALLQAGLLDTVKAAIAAASPIAQLAWSDATEFTRDSPTIAALSAQLGLTSAQVDALFVAASQIEA